MGSFMVLGSKDINVKAVSVLYTKRCHIAVKNRCKVVETDQDLPNKNQQDIGKSHTCNYMLPIVCNCGSILGGIVHQGFKCKDCGANIRKKGRKYFPMKC